MHVRPAATADVESVAALIEAAFAAFVAPDYTEEGRAIFRGYASPSALAGRLREGAVSRVAVADGAVVGYGELRSRDGYRPGVDHLTMLFTDPGWHRRGAARAVLAALLTAARRAMPGLDALAVNASPCAVPAYERLGFTRSGPDRRFRGMVSIPMRLPLN